MDINTILGYAGAFLTGISLGALGGGGALLSIPVLVYLFHIEPTVASGYSLFLVAVTASSGAIQNIRKKQVELRPTLYYAVPSVITVYCVRRFLIPNLPQTLFTIGSYHVDKDLFILMILVVAMALAAYKMITSEHVETDNTLSGTMAHITLAMYAVLIGILLGLLGAGGGFLMTPILIHFAGLNVKKAIGTSLVLVAINSAVGFLGDVHSNSNMDWQFLAVFSGFSIAGVVAGSAFTHNVGNKKLKFYFGWFLAVGAVAIALRELITRF